MNNSLDFKTIIDFIIERSDVISPTIKGTPNLTPQECLTIYRHDYQARLLGLLKEYFPITKRYLGEELFIKIAESYLIEKPPKNWKLSQYGDEFPDYLESNLNTLLTSDVPFIKELAQLEWASQIFFDEEAPKPLPLLTTPPSEDWINELTLSPQMRFFSSPFDIPSLYRWAQKQPESVEPLAIAISWQNPSFYFLSMNSDFLVELNDLTDTEFFVLSQWKKHLKLGATMEAIEALSLDSPQELEESLTEIPSLLSKLSRLGFIVNPS